MENEFVKIHNQHQYQLEHNLHNSVHTYTCTVTEVVLCHSIFSALLTMPIVQLAVCKYYTMMNIFLLTLVQCQDCERQTFLESLAQFCKSTVNEEECIVHKLLGDKFQVFFYFVVVYGGGEVV